MAYEFYPIERIIQLTPGTVELNVTDMYSRWKDWTAQSDNSKWLNAFEVIGGDPTIGGNRISPYYFLTNGWRVRPQEANHTLQVGGILLVQGGGDPYLSTIGTFNVRITAIVPLEAEFIVAQLPEIEFASFQNAVWVNESSMRQGVEYPTGTRQYAVNNIPDAVTIANARGFNRIGLIGNATVGDNVNIEDFVFFGQNQILSKLTIHEGAHTLRCEFRDLTIEGTLDGDSLIYNCNIGTLDYVNGEIHESLIRGPVSLDGEKIAYFIDCYGACEGDDSSLVELPIIDCNGTGHSLSLRRYTGGVTIRNKTGPDKVSADINSGFVVLDETVSNGNIVIRGTGRIENNSTGGIVNSEDLLNRHSISDAVLNEDIAQYGNNGIDNVANALQAISYDSMVIVDAVNGVAGTSYPIGTAIRPVNNLTDATAIAEDRGISTFFLNSDITVPFDYVATNNATIIGRGVKFVTITIEPGAQFQKIRAENLTVQGSGSTTVATFFRCTIRDLEVIGEAQFWECDLSGTLILHNETSLDSCRDIIPGLGLPTIQKAGIGVFDLGVWGYYGGLRLTNSDCNGCQWSFNIDSGRIVLDETITGGEFIIRGIGILVDNSTGTTVDTTSLISNTSVAEEVSVDNQAIAGAVWDKPLSEHTIAGSTGNALSTASTGGVDTVTLANAIWNKPMIENQQEGSFGESMYLLDQMVTRVKNINEGNWEIEGNQLVMYSTSGTEIARFNLYDSQGIPSNKEVFKRERV